jgi:hypothetical protein
MKRPMLLKRFEYSILSSSIPFAGAGKNYAVSGHLPLMKVIIDFEQGNLKLEGDWRFMMSSNEYNEASWFTYHKGRVQIETDVCASSIINLGDPGSDGLVFPLDGSIKDGNAVFSCSGLLVLDNARGINGLAGNQWDISLYLYDLQFDNCEIKFRLPVFVNGCSENKDRSI